MSRLIFRAVYDFVSLEDRRAFVASNPARPPERLQRIRARRKAFLKKAAPKPVARPVETRECPDCADGGACLPGGCGIPGCLKCGKLCPTCKGTCELPVEETPPCPKSCPVCAFVKKEKNAAAALAEFLRVEKRANSS